MKKKCTCGGLQAYAEGGRTRVPTRSTRFIDPEAERIRGRSALEALRGYAGAPSQSSAMYPGSQEAYESGELAGMAEMLIPGAAMAKGALGAALAGVIKPRGGNWLNYGLEHELSGLKRAMPSEARDAYGNVVPNVLANSPVYRENAAINQWIQGPLTKYIKRDLATPEDPIRRLAEEGILPQGIGAFFPEPLVRYRRQLSGFPEEGLAKSPEAKQWEEAADFAVQPRTQEELTTQMREDNPWLERVGSGEALYDLSHASSRSLGLPHLVDELSNALNPESGLPRNLQLTPEKMEQMGMEKAVRHVDAINKWRAEQKIAANQELANKALAVREYPDTPELPNPKGLRWVELSKDSPDLEKQLKYEGDTMGHCVGGYCPDVLEGKSRIFSLRDAKGEPHVTVEVKPQGVVFSDVAKYLGEEEADRLLDQGVTLSEMIEKIPNFERPMKIQQIKGKQNRRPKDEYLPFVQDFVRNSPLGGTWGDVGDLGNARLHRLEDESGIKYLTPEEYSLPRKKEGGLVTQPDYFDDLDAFLRR